MQVEIIMYHYIRNLKNSRYPKIKGLDIHDFKKQISYLENNYNFVSTQDILKAAYENKPLPERAVLLTFDDGYIDHFTNVFPVLMEKKIKAFFAMPGKILREKKVLDVNKIHFILASADSKIIKQKLFERLDYFRGTEFSFPDNAYLYDKYGKIGKYDDADTVFIKRILQAELDENLRIIITDELFKNYVTDNEEAFVEELYLSRDQINLMYKSGMYFGIHGYEHYHFDKLRKETFAPDIEKAKDVFDGIIDPLNWVFCYPYGGVSDELQEYCKNSGCIAGLTCEVRTAVIGKDDIYRLPRYDTNDYPPKCNVHKSIIR